MILTKEQLKQVDNAENILSVKIEPKGNSEITEISISDDGIIISGVVDFKLDKDYFEYCYICENIENCDEDIINLILTSAKSQNINVTYEDIESLSEKEINEYFELVNYKNDFIKAKISVKLTFDCNQVTIEPKSADLINGVKGNILAECNIQVNNEIIKLNINQNLDEDGYISDQNNYNLCQWFFEGDNEIVCDSLANIVLTYEE